MSEHEHETQAERPAGPEPAGDAGSPQPLGRDLARDLERGRHPVNIGQLVMGLAFASFVVIWALLVGEAIETDDLRWLLPVPWVLGGAVGLAAVALGGRGRRTG
ncbi:hypothetical protein [Nocardioides donggukensis]|uniref:DUF2530 domain-containing protein n=1 Tax=Nocardioides donggukensis TaxID=2774019 RepID=A0A927K2P9_9ACTN|nr:hypothetical protein [Nocardioides donggukensis]MBD8868596.1 hypothetical protein [Nocardioides donggukensis]